MGGASLEDTDESESDNAEADGVAMLARLTRSDWRRSGTRLGPLPGGSTSARMTALDPAVTRKIVCSQPALDDERFSSWARELDAAGAQVRVASGWVPDLAISDSRAAVISADPDDPYAKPARIEHPLVVSILILIFDQAWNASVPLEAAVTIDRTNPAAAEPARKPATGSRELAAAQRELLKLLADGATDESVARHLGISLRTARRHVAALMTNLAATSRFQAGAEAAKRGWLS
jgi:DNA-binding CsgD family transcriptional regulator